MSFPPQRSQNPGFFGGRPLDQVLGVEEEEEGAVRLDHLVEGLRLIPRAREPVQDEAGLRVLLLEPLPHHLDHEVVGHELPRADVALRLLSELRLLRDLAAEDVARRDVRHPVVLREADGLRALPGARRSEQDELHRPKERMVGL